MARDVKVKLLRDQAYRGEHVAGDEILVPPKVAGRWLEAGIAAIRSDDSGTVEVSVVSESHIEGLSPTQIISDELGDPVDEI